MKNNQTIMCNVRACKFNDANQCCCKLPSITVTPCDDCSTAHYCRDYEEKHN